VSFWGGRKILDELSADPIVAPFNANQIDCNAYTLRMGAEAYVTPDYGAILRRNKKQVLKEATKFQTPLGDIPIKGGGLVIPSGQFAFLLTEERVDFPADVMGFISLKSRVKFRGLINVSGFHVDPGFSGHLIYSVFNAGPNPIHIQRGDLLFLLWFADLSGPAQVKYRKNMAVPQLEIPSDLISDVAKEVQSVQRISDRLDFVERRLGTIWNGTILIGSILALFFAFLQVRNQIPNPFKTAASRIQTAPTPPDTKHKGGGEANRPH
jgi:dCTP deaminase